MQSEKKSLCLRAWPGCGSLPLAWMLLQHAEASGGCSCCAGLTGPTLTLPRACHSRGPTATLSPTLGLRMGKRVFPRSRRRPKGLVPSADSFRTTGTAVPKDALVLGRVPWPDLAAEQCFAAQIQGSWSANQHLSPRLLAFG